MIDLNQVDRYQEDDEEIIKLRKNQLEKIKFEEEKQIHIKAEKVFIY
jgi:hypothetical protein